MPNRSFSEWNLNIAPDDDEARYSVLNIRKALAGDFILYVGVTTLSAWIMGYITASGLDNRDKTVPLEFIYDLLVTSISWFFMDSLSLLLDVDLCTRAIDRLKEIADAQVNGTNLQSNNSRGLEAEARDISGIVSKIKLEINTQAREIIPRAASAMLFRFMTLTACPISICNDPILSGGILCAGAQLRPFLEFARNNWEPIPLVNVADDLVEERHKFEMELTRNFPRFF